MLLTSAPTPFPKPFGDSAGAGYIRPIPTASQISVTPGAASLTDGFVPLNFTEIPAGGVAIDGQDMNGILKEITAAVQWLQAGGFPTYDSTFQTAIGGYPAGAAILNSNANGFWISTVDNNLTNPNTGGAGWKNLNGTYLDKSVAGNTDVTLTVLEATYSILDCGGVLTGNINVIVPAAGNEWTIRNSTTGAFGLTVKTPSGSGVQIPQGSTVVVYSDGTNVYYADTPHGSQQFTANGSWVCPAGVVTAYISGAAGGGGGGGAGATGAAGGGGCGQSIIKQPFAVVPGTTYTVTVGAAGTAGTAGGAGNGGNGGTSSFGALVSLTGGSGALSPSSGSSSGGASGGQGGAYGTSGISGNGGHGGGGIFGGGGPGNTSGVSVAGIGAGYGAGGGGGCNGSAGANGAQGFFIVEW